VLATVVMGALPVAEWGSDTQKQRLLPAAIAGESILTAAVVEPGTDPLHPNTTATVRGDEWRLDGVKICVPAGPVADYFLVPARTGEDGVGVFIVGAGATGVTVVAEETTSRQPEARLELRGTVVPAADVLGDPDGIGVDRDYPLHRYFLWAKHLEFTLGGATSHLLRLGALLADEPV
jgi:3-oxocholest-4-en-26-oyl-CoA dehydrogenase beta subunit